MEFPACALAGCIDGGGGGALECELAGSVTPETFPVVDVAECPDFAESVAFAASRRVSHCRPPVVSCADKNHYATEMVSRQDTKIPTNDFSVPWRGITGLFGIGFGWVHVISGGLCARANRKNGARVGA